ncbi:MAG TPA: hypothetical protein PLX06_14985 [Fimbriimonadaceae bacterium]|nr:hypothetical protein [Fimbriimonadaceae bacterium]
MIPSFKEGDRVVDLPLWLTHYLPPIPLLIEAATLPFGKTVHNPIFKGEFGFWEIGTVLLCLAGFFTSLAIAFGKGARIDRPAKLFLLIVGLGCLYLAGEEASWGQHIFRWEAPEAWQKVNYQAETNVHNLWDIPFTNVIPRFLLTLGVFVGGLWGPFRMHRRGLNPKGRAYWLWPTIACMVTAFFVLVPPIPKKLGLPSLPEPGETEEFYMALFLALYLGSILVRRRSLGNEVSSTA